MGTVTIINPTADAEIGDMTSIVIDAQPDPGETPDQVRLTIEEISSPEHSTQPLVGAWGPFTNQIPWSPPGTGFTHRPQQHRITVEVQFRKSYPPPPSTSTASASVLVWVITTIVRDVTPEYLLWNPDVGQPLQITWTLEHAAPISSPPLRKRVHIFDLSGQRVRSLYYNPQVDPDNEFTDTAPGSQVEVWDGRGDPDPVSGEQPVLPRGVYSFEIFAEHLFDSDSHQNTAQYLTVDDVRLCLTGSSGAQTNMEVSCLLSEPGASPQRQPSKMRALLFNWDLTKLDEKSISNPPLSPTRAAVTTLIANLSDARPYFVAVIAEDGRRDEDRMHRYRPAIVKGFRDDWLSLRAAVSRTNIRDTVTNQLFVSLRAAARSYGEKTTTGDNVLFSDCPEHLNDTVAGDPPNGNDNVILFADTNGLTPGEIYRFFLHHDNNTAEARQFRLRVRNTGLLPATVTFGPVNRAMGTNRDPAEVGRTAVDAYLQRYPVADLDPLDARAPGATQQFTLQPNDMVDLNVTEAGQNNGWLTEVTVDPQQLLAAIGEISASDSGVVFYVVVGNPQPDSGDQNVYLSGGQNARTRVCATLFHRGTFPDRLITHIQHTALEISSTTETPWVKELVDAVDRTWGGDTFDRSLWNNPQRGNNEGNWGRMFYVWVRIENKMNRVVRVAVVAQPPRAAITHVKSVIRDLGANDNFFIPRTDSIDSNNQGTVIWKGQLQPDGQSGSSVEKRLRYTPVGGSGAVMNIWVIPWC